MTVNLTILKSIAAAIKMKFGFSCMSSGFSIVYTSGIFWLPAQSVIIYIAYIIANTGKISHLPGALLLVSIVFMNLIIAAPRKFSSKTNNSGFESL